MPEGKNEGVTKNNSTKEVEQENTRWALLQELEEWLEGPVTFLGLVWLGLLVIELIWDIEENLEYVVYTIWVIFVLDFLLRLILAPRKVIFLRKNSLMVISLMIPAIRLLHIFRFAHHILVLRSGSKVDLNKMASSANRVREIIQTLVDQLKGKEGP